MVTFLLKGKQRLRQEIFIQSFQHENALPSLGSTGEMYKIEWQVRTVLNLEDNYQWLKKKKHRVLLSSVFIMSNHSFHHYFPSPASPSFSKRYGPNGCHDCLTTLVNLSLLSDEFSGSHPWRLLSVSNPFCSWKSNETMNTVNTKNKKLLSLVITCAKINPRINPLFSSPQGKYLKELIYQGKHYLAHEEVKSRTSIPVGLVSDQDRG